MRHPLKSPRSVIRPQFFRGEPDKTLIGVASHIETQSTECCEYAISIWVCSPSLPCVPFVPLFSSLAPQICSEHHGITAWVVLADLLSVSLLSLFLLLWATLTVRRQLLPLSRSATTYGTPSPTS